MAELPWRAILEGFGLGVLASGVFFAGLAWSLRHALGARRPALLLLASYLLRAGLLLGAGWWLMLRSNSPWSLLAYLLAFFIVRSVVWPRARRRNATPPPDPLEGG